MRRDKTLEEGIATDLIEHGIPRQDSVLGFQSP
ncbi:MAG: hypothetical protein GY801_30465 [bacterium]|nr:hypothetical protein [bacterium]